MIPENIQQQIKDKYAGLAGMSWRIESATFGYNISLKELEEKDKRIKELEDICSIVLGSMALERFERFDIIDKIKQHLAK